MREYQRIRAAVTRGGASQGVFLLAGDLPAHRLCAVDAVTWSASRAK
jgi:2-methylaconitate cis-trans-isomerase PrpF